MTGPTPEPPKPTELEFDSEVWARMLVVAKTSALFALQHGFDNENAHRASVLAVFGVSTALEHYYPEITAMLRRGPTGQHGVTDESELAEWVVTGEGPGPVVL